MRNGHAFDLGKYREKGTVTMLSPNISAYVDGTMNETRSLPQGASRSLSNGFADLLLPRFSDPCGESAASQPSLLPIPAPGRSLRAPVVDRTVSMMIDRRLALVP
jgi:hypothetical protein